MTRTFLLILSSVLALSACGRDDPEVSARNATAEEVAEKIGRAGGSESFVRAGKWESRVTIEEMGMPGMPPELAERMKGMAGQGRVHTQCLTEEESQRPKEDFFAGDDRNCRYERFDMGGGKIDAVMRCDAEGVAQTMTMQGSYDPDSYRMTMTMAGGSGNTVGMSMKMRVDARRVGECDE